MTRAALVVLAALLLGCTAQTPGVSRAPVATAPAVDGIEFPAQAMPRGLARSNITLAEDFLDLAFALESGQRLQSLLRHERPVRVMMVSPALAPYRRDLENLLARLRAEAGIDISSTTDPAQAQMVIEGVPSRDIQGVYPGAACFIVPGETSWASFRAKSNRSRTRWSDQTTLGTTGIFVPSDSTPQDIRDCLHEEIGQALGPANDIYRLPDTVFNDDNFHSVLTAFDMLMLRVLYSPELRSGMTREAVARRLPSILARLNPAGQGFGTLPRAAESAEWKREIETAMTRRGSEAARLRAANRAVAIAGTMSPPDHRLGVALMTRGRLTLRSDTAAAAGDFAAAYRFLRARLGAEDMRTAQAALHLAIFALRQGDHAIALDLARPAVAAAREGQNAVLLSGLLTIQAEALLNLGQPARAQALRVESLKWARYAFGDSDGTIARAQAELEAIDPIEFTPPARAAR